VSRGFNEYESARQEVHRSADFSDLGIQFAPATGAVKLAGITAVRPLSGELPTNKDFLRFSTLCGKYQELG
jgi:hypothetical protein